LILEERSDGECSCTNPLDVDVGDWRVTYSADEAPARAAPEQAMTRESARNSPRSCELSDLSAQLRRARPLERESDYLGAAGMPDIGRILL
jgi:hypothetical protein